MKSAIKVFAPYVISGLGFGRENISVAIDQLGVELLIGESSVEGIHVSSKQKSKVDTYQYNDLIKCIVKKLLSEEKERSKNLDIKINFKMPLSSEMNSHVYVAVAAVFGINRFLGTGWVDDQIFEIVDRSLSEVGISGLMHLATTSLKGGIILQHNAKERIYRKIYEPRGLYWVLMYPVGDWGKGLYVDDKIQFGIDEMQILSSNSAAFVTAMHSSDFELIELSLKNSPLYNDLNDNLIFQECKSLNEKSESLGFGLNAADGSLFYLTSNSMHAEGIKLNLESLIKKNNWRAKVILNQTLTSGAYLH